MNETARSALVNGAMLALVAVLGVALLAGVERATGERIAAQEARVVRERLAQVLPPQAYDNDPRADSFAVSDPALPGPVRVYPARLRDRPVAAVLEVHTQEGYNGEIVLLVGVWRDGSISGVRVTRHRETPGLGDPIEARRSDWIEGFRGRSLADPGRGGWAVRKDGGEFDQFTGATVTPRAVVGAVRAALEWSEAHREELFGKGD